MEHATPEMIDAAEANIRADHRAGKISKEQFQKELLIVTRARQQAIADTPAFTSSEIEKAAAHCERVASEYEARATDPNCNRDHYLRAAERERQEAAGMRSRSALSPFKAKEE